MVTNFCDLGTASDWETINFHNSHGSFLNHCIVEYGGSYIDDSLKNLSKIFTHYQELIQKQLPDA